MFDLVRFMIEVAGARTDIVDKQGMSIVKEIFQH